MVASSSRSRGFWQEVYPFIQDKIPAELIGEIAIDEALMGFVKMDHCNRTIIGAHIAWQLSMGVL